MQVMIVAIHWAVASGRYAADALIRMGHDVKTVGPLPDPPNAIWGITVDPKYIWWPSEVKKGWEPELTIIMDSEIQVTKNWPGLTCVFGVDNHARSYSQFDHLVDCMFLAHGHGLRVGEPNVVILPCAYDKTYFTPGKPWAEREHNAAMLAVQYPQRAALLAHLLDGTRHGIQYHLAVYDQYAAIYQNAKISLVVSAAGDVAQRVWETAAMGCLVLMDDCPDSEALGLVDGENCLIYHSFEEAVIKYDWALAHPDEAAVIAAAGQAWAVPGTWDARVQTIIEWAAAKSQPKKAGRAK